MLDTETKRRIDSARDILVGKVPDPKAQVEQITTALIYKFMDDMDRESMELGGKAKFFSDGFEQYSWTRIISNSLSGFDRLNLYSEAIQKMTMNKNIPQLFRDMFKGAFLPYRDSETLNLFLKEIDSFTYDHSEKLGDAFEYLLSVLGSQGDAGQFRTPRHIIDFMVRVVNPQKNDTILDPACGTAGFLISAYKHIVKFNKTKPLTPDEKARLTSNFTGYDISPDMVKLSLVNMYLHNFPNPKIQEYDTLTSEDKWDDTFDVVLANPPFMSPKGGIRPHQRFTVKAKRSEVLFVDYIAEHLNISGRAGIIVPEGIIFQSQNAYKELRKMLVAEYLYAVVSLPAGVFNPYAGVKTSILLMDKAIANKSDNILFVKIENDGFDLGAQRRAIDKNDISIAEEIINQYRNSCNINSFCKEEQITDALKKKFPVSKLWSIATKEKIADSGDYNLSGERYKVNLFISNSVFEMKPIGEVCELINGRAFKPVDWEKESSGGLPIIRIQNLNNAQAQFNYYTGEVNKKVLVQNGQLLFSWSGSKGTSFGAHIWDGGDAILNQHIFKVQFDKAIVLKRFLYYALNEAVAEVEDNLHGGVGLVHITKGNLEKIQIPLPPLEIQKEIVEEIEGYQKIIDGARQVVENYKPQIQIDPSWEMVELGEVCEVNPKKSEVNNLPSDLEVSFVPMADLNENQIDFTPTQQKPLGEVIKGYTYFKENDVLLAKVTPCFENGKAGIAKNLVNKIGFGSSEYYVFRPNEKILSAWIYLNIISNSFKLTGKAKMTGTGGLQRVPKGFVITSKIPLPDVTTQKQIVDQIDKELELVNANKELIKIYEQKIKDRIDRVWGE